MGQPMTPQEIADRIRVCVAIGSIQGAVELMRAHGNDIDVLANLNISADATLRDWVFYGSPYKSLFFRQASECANRSAMSVKLANKLNEVSGGC